jgi:hypothetical protein
MKRLHSTAALLIFGLATPLLTQAFMPMVAVAQANNLEGSFSDREWDVHVYYRNNSYRYRGQQRGSNRSIELSGATVSKEKDGSRKIYTWNNNGTRYQVVWQHQDPDYIRVRVTTPRGKEVLNRLLSRCQQGC